MCTRAQPPVCVTAVDAYSLCHRLDLLQHLCSVQCVMRSVLQGAVQVGVAAGALLYG